MAKTIASGAPIETVHPTITSQLADTLLTRKPIARFDRAPETGAGRNLIEVSVALSSCTSWK